VDRKHTLLAVLDRTKTPMGARRLRGWILHPIRDLKTLQQRQQFIGSAVDEAFLLSQCQDTLKSIRDIERTSSRLSQNSGNARDLQALSNSLAAIPTLKRQLLDFPNQADLATQLVERLVDFSDLVHQLETALCEEPVAGTKDGGMIATGFHEELDQLRSASTEGKNWMAELQHKERERTGIDSLKIKYNNVFGYFIEITKAKVDQAPEDYQRKQTMANAERFITPELKEMENKILGADERANQLEYEIFCELREAVKNRLTDLQNTSDALSEIDVLLGLAQVALTYNHCCPELDESCDYELVNARHPVLEQTLIDEPFIPNDTRLDAEEARLMILTGPNMAGKSTYIRQVALIAVMAQMGAFVPAESARIGLVDRIFCRVGASDNLAGGQSTFMVEMSETALILNNATDRSLVILDEIGRGTATYDGLSIACSVAEYLHDVIKARSLFATHYHEMTDLSQDRPAIRNFYVAVREWNEEIIFLRKILAGTADRSYGIQVAKLAGIPNVILDRAKSILHELEFGEEGAKPTIGSNKQDPNSNVSSVLEEPEAELSVKKKPKQKIQKRDSSQMSFF